MFIKLEQWYLNSAGAKHMNAKVKH